MRLIGEGAFWRALLQPEIVKILLVSLLLFLVPILLWKIPFFKHLLLSAPSWKNIPHIVSIFLICGVIYNAIGLPKQPLCIAAGLAFGLWKAVLFMGGICVSGAVITYFFGRIFLGNIFQSQRREQEERSSGLFQNMEAFAHSTPFLAILMMRLMPIGSALLLSLTCGVMKLPLPAFIFGSLFGSLPQIFVFVLVGASGVKNQEFNLIFAVFLFILSALLGIFLLKKYRSQA